MSAMRDEFMRGGHVLGVSAAAYMVVCFLATHLVALIMLDAASAFGVSIAAYSLAQGAGNLIKGVGLVFAGPAMQHFGAHNVANGTLAVSTALLAALAVARSRTSFFAALVSLISVTALAEQPTYVVIQATFFDALQSIATSTITTSYSASGAILPLIFAPILAESGWRAVCLQSLGLCAVVLPASLLVIKKGPLSVGEQAVASPTTGTSPLSLRASDASATGLRASNGSPPAIRPVGPSAGLSLKEVVGQSSFWALAAANYLFMVYAAIIVNHLPFVLRTDGGLGVVPTAQVMSLQFAAAMSAKFGVGVLMALPSPPRFLLFIGMPAAYTATHLLLVDVAVDPLLAADFGHALVVSQELPRLRVYGVLTGLAFGSLFGLIQCLPIRLFGRRCLPTIQSLMYAIVIFGNASVLPLMGALRDAYDETYSMPLLLSFIASALLQLVFNCLLAADRAASAATLSLL